MSLLSRISLLAFFVISVCSGTFLYADKEKDIMQKNVVQDIENSFQVSPTIILSPEETAILDRFINVMFKYSEGGYVLYGMKPMCFHGFNVFDSFGGDCEVHRQYVYLREGASLWKKIFQNKMSNIIIHIYDRPENQADDVVGILFINKKMFCETVEKNIALFQYVLGPNVTPLALLDRLTDPNTSFDSVLKSDRVLMGILLGFGVQNALHVSRIENLQVAYLSSPEQFPWKNRLTSLNSLLGGYQDVLLLSSEQRIGATDLNPSFSYTSLEEEIRDAISKIECSSQKLLEKRPYFIFGRLLQDEESDFLIRDLEETQEKIIALLNSDQPLQPILKMVYPNCLIELQRELTIPTPVSIAADRNHLQTIVAKNTWASICNETLLFINGFYKGMQDANKGNKDLSIDSTGHYEILKAVVRAKENAERADRFFAELDKDVNAVPVKRGEIYYKVLQKGDGEILDFQQTVKVHCRAITPDGLVICDTWANGSPIVVELSEAIQGFAWGMKGMQEGEIREIFMHPKVAYGIYTTLEKGIYLRAEVQLLSIEPSENSSTFPTIEPLDFEAIFSRLNKYNLEEIANNEGYLLGYSIWDHYKKEDSLTFSEILDMLKALERSQSFPMKKSIQVDAKSMSASDRSILNSLHWNLYQKSLDEHPKQ